MSISPKSGARGLERLICFKYYIVLKWESRLIFELNTVEIANYIVTYLVLRTKNERTFKVKLSLLY